MAETQSWPRLIRFGAFEADLRTGELRKDGLKLKFSGQPFKVLVILLERRGDVVTREELQKRLWPDTFVDVERNLNTAVNKIREVLGDSAESPRFIETLSRRGYRFIAPVESDPSLANLALANHDPGRIAAIPAFSDAAPHHSTQVHEGVGDEAEIERLKYESRNGLWKWVLTGAGLFAVGLAVAVWYLGRPLPSLRVTEYTEITHDGRSKLLAGTDGSRLYFNWDYGLQPIAQVAISGGESAPVPIALPLPAIRDVSPDGSTLLVASYASGQGSLWSVQIPTGSLRRLLTDVSVSSAAWSLDGKSVVYSTGNGDVDVIRSNGTGNRKLTTLGGSSDALSWSPDGSKIRFSRDNRLWEMSSDGSGLHPLLPGWPPSSSQCCGRWTPDVRIFVFLSQVGFYIEYSNLPASQLWVLDERRGLLRRTPSKPVQLTSGPIFWNTPIPSKDGKKIFADGVILRGELVRYDAQSSRFRPYLGGNSVEFVTFSSDGQFVAYVTFPEGILWKANRDGSHAVQLTDAPLYPLNPHWSPDGSQILFCNSDSKGLKAYVASSQGGTPQPLLPEDREGQSDPSWSPDGRKIVFSTLVRIGDFNSVLRVLDLASHQITTLPGSEGMWSPRWSPNGRFIAGIHTGPTGGLKVFDVETQRWLVLQLKGETGWPTWSSNSKFIYFLRAQDDPGVFRVRVSDRAEERVVDLKGFRYTGAFTLWMGLDPEDTPLLIRDVGTADIYALALDEK